MSRLRINCRLVSWRITDIDEGGPSIEIVGRQSGLMSYLLRLVGMSPTVLFALEGGKLRMMNSSLSGQFQHMVPMEKVRSAKFGFVKPWKAALSILIGAFFFASRLSGAIHSTGSFQKFVSHGGLYIPILAFAAVAAFFYFTLNRQLAFSVTAKSGEQFEFQFYPSFIEGVMIDESEGLKALQTLQRATYADYIAYERTAA